MKNKWIYLDKNTGKIKKQIESINYDETKYQLEQIKNNLLNNIDEKIINELKKRKLIIQQYFIFFF